MKKILEIGSGKNPYKPKTGEEVIHLDAVKFPDIEIVHNLNVFPWPFDDNEFDEIICFMVLEHVNDLIKSIEELYRISKPKAIIKIKVPFFPSMYSAIDPTHKHFFTYYTFDYFSSEHSLNYYSKARFKVIKKEIVYSWNRFLNFPAVFFNLVPRFYNRYLSGIFPSNELYFELETMKTR